MTTPLPTEPEPESREYVPPTAEDLRWYRRSIAGSAPEPYPVPSVRSLRSLRSWQEAK